MGPILCSLLLSKPSIFFWRKKDTVCSPKIVPQNQVDFLWWVNCLPLGLDVSLQAICHHRSLHAYCNETPCLYPLQSSKHHLYHRMRERDKEISKQAKWWKYTYRQTHLYHDSWNIQCHRSISCYCIVNVVQKHLVWIVK